MSWSKYAEFLVFAVLLVLVPGPDFAVVTKNALAGGRRRGNWTSAGVASSNLVQGTAAACGLSAVIVRAQPVFQTLKDANPSVVTVSRGYREPVCFNTEINMMSQKARH